MKCIGEKCRYYHNHDFRLGYFTCSLDGRSFTKVDGRDCLIKNIIQDMRDDLIEIEEYSKIIEDNQ